MSEGGSYLRLFLASRESLLSPSCTLTWLGQALSDSPLLSYGPHWQYDQLEGLRWYGADSYICSLPLLCRHYKPEPTPWYINSSQLNIWSTYCFMASMQSSKIAVPKSQSIARREKIRRIMSFFTERNVFYFINWLWGSIFVFFFFFGYSFH